MRVGRALAIGALALALHGLPLDGGARTSAGPDATPSAGLQARIDAAAPGSTIRVRGTWAGPLRIDKPLVLEGAEGAMIVGDGAGSVIEIAGSDVTVRGLEIRRSGRATSAEAAGVKAAGDRHRIEDNVIEDVYFGVHLSDGDGNVVIGNRIVPGMGSGVRPGHAVSLWYQRGALVQDNDIEDARDGVYLSFADDVRVIGNRVRGSRYGVHSMYSERSVFEGNVLEDNLLGTALMYSTRLQMRCNRIERHREGATAYAILLKDIDDVVLADNVLVGNRVGIYADNVPLGRGTEAILRDNLIAGSDAALALQSTVRLTFFGNTVVDNLTAVRSEGGRLSTDNRWSRDGRGNHWDDYAGYDADGDGVGDLAYRYEAVFDELVRRTPALRAFLYTPIHVAIESAARAFPVIPRQPLVIDEHPLMRPGARGCEPPAPGNPARNP